jgi:hypothetical protein
LRVCYTLIVMAEARPLEQIFRTQFSNDD